jgi:hypothetical protein
LSPTARTTRVALPPEEQNKNVSLDSTKLIRMLGRSRNNRCQKAMSMEKAAPAASEQRRAARLSTRITASSKQIIQMAAARRQMTVSAFILAEVEPAARRVMDSQSERTPGTFEVLCRIDAFADYAAEVEAADADEAVAMARGNHEDYKWEHRFTQEFDARLYVALDEAGNEIEETELGDF